MSGMARMTGISNDADTKQELIFYDKNGRVFPETVKAEATKTEAKAAKAEAKEKKSLLAKLKGK